MRIVLDVEANALINPTEIWVVVCKDIDTGKYYTFRNLTSDVLEKERFYDFWRHCKYYIGHNLLGYDAPVLADLLGVTIPDAGTDCLDTLILGKLANYSRAGGHSVEDYGREFGLEKVKFNDFSKYSDEMVDYCTRDVDITHRIYLKYLRYINRDAHSAAIALEHRFQLIVNQLTKNGFSFNQDKAERLLSKVSDELAILDESILSAFPKRFKLIREVLPKATKFGTISLTSIPKSLRSRVEEMEVDVPFPYGTWEEFNPSSHKQIVNVLSEAGWKPTEKTGTHIETERKLRNLERQKQRSAEVDLQIKNLYTKLSGLGETGWKVNETNLATLPSTAPAPAKTLAKRILLESRRRTLTEWLSLLDPCTGRIHGRFYGIGAWTHRMAHQQPNTANIPNEFDNLGNKKLLGKELRSLWQAPHRRLLVGVDAEGIQLRIFAHLINDPEFTQSLVAGKKENKSDPHSLNQRILGPVCKDRQQAKRFIYALLLGAGMGKLAEILGCEPLEAEEALERLLVRYQGFDFLKREVIPKDAKRGWFTGLDGRSVAIPSDTVGGRRHLAMSGYLQNGEAVVMKLATLKWHDKLKHYDSSLVNFVHDEWQTEVPNNMEVALAIARLQAESLRSVGEDLKLLCPLAGSYWSDQYKDYTIATNWSKTH